MVKNTRCLILVLAAVLMASSAQAAMVSLVGTLDSSNINFGTPGSVTTSPKLGYGGGILIDSMLTPHVAFEFGGLYITRKTEVDGVNILGSGVGNINQQTTAIQIPVVLRLHILPMISIGFGGYWAYGVGNVNYTTTSGTSLGDGSYSAEQLKNTDLGLIGSVGIRIPMGSSGVKFLVDGRYSYGMTDINNGVYTGLGAVKYRDVQGLVGFSFPLHSH